MNLDNIVEGEIFSNYKALCQKLGVEPKGGKSKTLQMAKLEEKVEYERNGNKIKIIRKRSEDEIQYRLDRKRGESLKGKSEGSRGNNTIFLKDVENILLFTLNNSLYGEVECPLSDAMLFCNMVNENFINLRMGDKACVEGYDRRMVSDFYRTTNYRARNIFERALVSLRYKALISHSKQIKIKYYNSERQVVEGIANTSQTHIILDKERETLLELGLSSIQEVFGRKLANTFYDAVKEKIQHLGIISYHEVYRIILNQSGIAQEVCAITASESRDKVNTNMTKSLMNTMQKKYEKNKLAFGYDSGNASTEEGFVETQQKLVDLLIKSK